MKLAPRQIEAFLAAPPPEVAGVVLYGPDDGVQRERLQRLLHAKKVDPADPFALVTFEADRVVSDPALLHTELTGLSFARSARAVCVSGAGEKFAPVLRDVVEFPALSAFLIVQAGELSPRSALRQLAETGARLAALPCYEEDDAQTASWLRRAFAAEGVQCESGVEAMVAGALAPGRWAAERFVALALLYLGDERRLTQATARALFAEVAEEAFDTLVFSAADGDAAKADATFRQLMTLAVYPVAVLRALQTHLFRLYGAKASMQDGQTPEQALAALKPPVFFKVAPRFRAQAQRLPLPRLAQALDRLNDAERLVKLEHRMAEPLAHRALLSVTRLLAN